MDSDDLKHSWLLRGIFGRKATDVNDADEEQRLAGDDPGRTRTGNRWGARGISVSADEAVTDSTRKPDDDFGEILEDDADDDDDDLEDHNRGKGGLAPPAGGSGGEEWRNEGRK